MNYSLNEFKFNNIKNVLQHFVIGAIISFIIFACSNSDEKVPENISEQPASIPSLNSFSAEANESFTLRLQIEFPDDTSNYKQVEIYRAEGETAPECGNETLVVTLNNFSQKNTIYNDDNLSDDSFYSYRACPIGADDQVSNNTSAVTAKTIMDMCFVGSTLVETPTGRTPLNKIRKGDIVYSFDIERQKVVESRVIALRNYEGKQVKTFKFGDKFTLTGVAEHKIFSPINENFIKLRRYNENLRKTEFNRKSLQLMTFSQGPVDFISNVDKSSTEEKFREARVYDIVVEKYHNYFANDVLVKSE